MNLPTHQSREHKCWEDNKFKLLEDNEEELYCIICRRVWKNTHTFNIGEVLFG